MSNFQEYIAKLNSGLIKSFGVPDISAEPADSNFSQTHVLPKAFEFSVEVTLTEAGKQFFKEMCCENFNGIYDGILHVYSEILRDWMPIGN